MIRTRFSRRFDHLLFQFGRQLFIVAELLSVQSAATGQRAKLARITIKFPRRSQGVNYFEAASRFHSHHFAAAAGKVPDDLADTILRDPDFREWIGSSKQGRALRNASLNAQ